MEDGDITKIVASDWVAHYARTQPHVLALRQHERGEERSWSELEARVSQIAYALRHRLGLSPGDRIANISDGDIRHFELQFACARAGLVWVPLNFRLTPAELADLTRDLRPKLMLTDSQWRSCAEELATRIEIPTVLSWEAGGELDALLDPDLRIDEHNGIDPDAPLMILFTSGTTGRPKAAIITLGAMAWQALNQAQFCSVAEAGSHNYAPLPLFHNGGLNSLSNPVLYFGGTVTVSPRFDPEIAVQVLGNPEYGITHVALVPIMFQMMAETPAFADADFRHNRCMIIGGGRLSKHLIDAYDEKGGRFAPQYGGTETGPTITSMNPARLDKIAAGSCGQKAMHVQVKLVGTDGHAVGTGDEGEIWVRGPAVTTGYLGRDASEDHVDGWLKTGDVARQDEEGFFFIVDRLKDMYKSGGENVYPAEVEQVLMLNPAVEEIAVIGVADAKWGEVGLAIAVAARGQNLTLDSLLTTCEGRLARYKQPKHLVLVEAMPRNVTGKISKAELRARFGGSKIA